MKKFLLSMIAIFAMTICGFAQMEVCSDACAPHANEADYSTGVIPIYPQSQDFPVLTVGVPDDQCVSIKVPTQINGGSINALLGSVTITVNSVTLNELVNLPAGLTACASANPMAADGTYTLRITGTPTEAGTYELKMKANIEGESSSAFVSMSLVNTYLNGSGVSTNIIISVVEAGAEATPVARITSDPATSTGGITDWTQAIRIAQGETVSYTSSSSNTDHVAWTFDGGSPATSTANTATVTYANTGTFTTTLVAYSES